MYTSKTGRIIHSSVDIHFARITIRRLESTKIQDINHNLQGRIWLIGTNVLEKIRDINHYLQGRSLVDRCQCFGENSRYKSLSSGT
jgi:hypothetical protein